MNLSVQDEARVIQELLKLDWKENYANSMITPVLTASTKNGWAESASDGIEFYVYDQSVAEGYRCIGGLYGSIGMGLRNAIVQKLGLYDKYMSKLFTIITGNSQPETLWAST